VTDSAQPALATRDGRVIQRFMSAIQGASLVVGSGIEAASATAVQAHIAGWCGL
jgi:hypothetical protein